MAIFDSVPLFVKEEKEGLASLPPTLGMAMRSGATRSVPCRESEAPSSPPRVLPATPVGTLEGQREGEGTPPDPLQRLPLADNWNFRGHCPGHLDSPRTLIVHESPHVFFN